jgi:hypothetical protein
MRKRVHKKRILIEKLGNARGKNTSQACESWTTIVHHQTISKSTIEQVKSPFFVMDVVEPNRIGISQSHRLGRHNHYPPLYTKGLCGFDHGVKKKAREQKVSYTN